MTHCDPQIPDEVGPCRTCNGKGWASLSDGEPLHCPDCTPALLTEDVLVSFAEYLRNQRWVVERTINAERRELQQLARAFLHSAKPPPDGPIVYFSTSSEMRSAPVAANQPS